MSSLPVLGSPLVLEVGLVLLIAVVVASVGSGYGAWQVTRLYP